MRALQLDYQALRRTSAAGAIVLLIGVAAATMALLEYRAAREDLAAQELRAAGARKSSVPSAVSAPQTPRDVEAAAQEVKLAQAALQRLSLPWDDLFNALESARASGIALLAIEPDPGKNLVKLTAEAKSAEDMLAYVERLQSAQVLEHVSLANHQVKQDDPLKPLRFAVVASWVKQP